LFRVITGESLKPRELPSLVKIDGGKRRSECTALKHVCDFCIRWQRGIVMTWRVKWHPFLQKRALAFENLHFPLQRIALRDELQFPFFQQAIGRDQLEQTFEERAHAPLSLAG